jgi:hypothetical protein
VLLVATAPSGDAHAAALQRAVRRALASLDAAGVPGRVLVKGEVIALLAAHETADMPEWSAGFTSASWGAVRYRGLALTRFPGTAVEPGWLSPLLSVRAECDIAIHLHPVGLGEAMTVLNRRLRNLWADRLIEIDRDAVADAGLEVGVHSAVDLRARLARNQAGSLRVSLTATARATTGPELDAASDALRQAFMTVLCHAETAHLRHLDAMATTWPIGLDRLDGAKLLDSTAVGTCVPWVDATCHDEHGYSLGRTLQGDAPIQLDPFDVGEHSNANVAVFAASGHGKSYALGMTVLEAAARGIGSIVVDPEGEYSGLVRSLGGTYLDLRPGCGESLNIFDAGSLDDADGDRRTETVGAVVALVTVLCGGALDEVERAHVDAAATEALEHASTDGRISVLGDCLGRLQSAAPRVAVVVRRFTSGGLGQLFNRPTSVRLDAPVVGIGLRDLKDELVPAATLVVAEWLWSAVRRERRRRHLVFDEVGLLCAHPPLRSLLVQLARRCRKYGVSLVVATQNAGDLLASEEGTVIATNPAIVLLGGHRGVETLRMQRAYSLTDGQRQFLERAGRGDFLLIAGQRRLTFHVEAPPLHHDLLTASRLPPAHR